MPIILIITAAVQDRECARALEYLVLRWVVVVSWSAGPGTFRRQDDEASERRFVTLWG